MWGGVVGLVRGLDTAGTLRARVFGENLSLRSFVASRVRKNKLQHSVQHVRGEDQVSTGTKRKGLLLATPVQRGILFWVPNVPTICKPAT